MIRCGTFRHVCHFYQSLAPHIQLCSCGATQFVTPLGESDGEYDDQWDDEDYDNAPEPPEPTGVIDREEYFWATYDYDEEEEED